ncbi:GAF domain-containing sensor histidine kinase [Rheinheimera sp. WS51]|uniref:GAF domain-containing sensor histidine kinase n=1 Tax=Rheinheimera sp. WS51 TaxID=3425886 RepID=UPI003D90B4EC
MNKTLQKLLLDISLDPRIDQGNLVEACQLVLTTLHSQLQVDRLSVWLHNSDNSCIDCICLLEQNNFVSVGLPKLVRSQFPEYFATLEHSKEILTFNAPSDLQNSELYSAYFKPLGITSILEAPIRYHGKIVGVLSVENNKTRVWTDDNVMIISVFSDILSRAINASERMTYQRQLKQLNSKLEQKILQRTKKLTQSLSQLKSAQHKVIESEKMASLGRMVAGLSHEINTPLGIAVTANSHAESTLLELEELFLNGQLTSSIFAKQGETIKNSIVLAGNNLKRSVDLVESIKQTALEPASSLPAYIQLDQFIPQVISSLAEEISACQLTVKVEIPQQTEIKTYASALATVIRQLIENTCLHAFTDQQQRRLNLNITLQESTWCLTLTDNGKGMPEHQLSRAFEPFYTTNRSGGSKGLGLTLVFNLVTQILQGQLELKSNSSEFSVQITCPLNPKLQLNT